jgi:hypothetical protein
MNGPAPEIRQCRNTAKVSSRGLLAAPPLATGYLTTTELAPVRIRWFG